MLILISASVGELGNVFLSRDEAQNAKGRAKFWQGIRKNDARVEKMQKSNLFMRCCHLIGLIDTIYK